MPGGTARVTPRVAGGQGVPLPGVALRRASLSCLVDAPFHTHCRAKRMLMSSQGLRVIGALLEIRSMPLAA